MPVEELSQLARDAMMLLVVLVLPPVGASLIAGLAVSIVQTATQIQEQTISFAVRAAAVIASLIIAGPWIGSQLQAFTEDVFRLISAVSL